MGALSSLKKAKPLYSAFDEALAGIKRPKGTGMEFLTEVMKQPGVKKAEVEDRKLKQAFEKAGKMTKEEAQALAQKNAPAKIEEKVLSEPTPKEIKSRADDMAYEDARTEAYDQGYGADTVDEVADEIYQDIINTPSLLEDYMQRAADDLMEGGVSPQHGEWTLPGGENYREILLKMPAFSGDRKLAELEATRRRLDPEYHSHRYNELTQQIDALKAEKAQHPEQFQGVSAHFAGEPGIIASLRVKDRVGPNGEKVLHIEEIQSDWHQQGRKKGYASEYEPEADMLKKRDDLYDARTALVKEALAIEKTGELAPQELIDRIHGMNDELRLIEERKDKARMAIPDAPFKKNWQELALKKALNYAAENGYDKIAITPGAEQAERYSLAKRISGIDYIRNELKPQRNEMIAYDKNGNVIFNQFGMTPEKLEENIGKEAANKLLSQESQPNQYGLPTHSLRGEELVVGGEGMKGFYDKILPGYLNEFGKKYGTKVGELDIETHPANVTPQVAAPGIDYFPEPIVEPAQKKKVHSFDITPEMREEITTKGLPMYQQIGLPLGTGVGSYEFNAPEPEYASGGAVNYNTDPDMSDGGEIIQGAPYKKGGKVRITDNLDEMFMEVNNKKFQRK